MRKRLRRTPLTESGKVWQPVVDVDPGPPAPSNVLATCHGFLLDDDRGREVGVVEDVGMDTVSGRPAQLRVARGSGGQQTTLSVDDVIDVAPGDRLLVIGSRADQCAPRAADGSVVAWRSEDPVGAVRSLVARLRVHRRG